MDVAKLKSQLKVEDMPNIGKQIIHEHKEMAEKLAIVLYALGVISLA